MGVWKFGSCGWGDFEVELAGVVVAASDQMLLL